MKTNAARVLERLGIPHQIRTYAVDPDDLSAWRVAEKVGLPAGQLFKTLRHPSRQLGLRPAKALRFVR